MTTVMGIPSILIAVPIFVLLFTVISKTLQQRPLLGGNADVVLSLCVAALCILSVFHVTPVPTASSSQESVAAAASEETTDDTPRRPLIEFILLPYAALLLTLPFVWLLKLLTSAKQPSDNCRGKDRTIIDKVYTLKDKMFRNRSITKSKPNDRTDY
jgi:hypothetical protein